MKISRLVIQEIAHRFLNFVLAVVGVSIAVACLVASVTMIDAGEIESKQLVAERQKEVEKAVTETATTSRTSSFSIAGVSLMVPLALVGGLLVIGTWCFVGRRG